MKYYLAIDIGASSGRHIIGWKDGNEIKTDEVYRFPNSTKKQNGHLVWYINSLFENVKKGIKQAFKKYSEIESIAIDTWGCDYVLMNGDREITPCLSYRDLRTEQVIKKLHSIIPFDELYGRTGIQFQPFNSIYQLYDDKERKRLDMATDFLMIPEYIVYKLTGIMVKEYTNATTTGLVNAVTGEFDEEIIERLGLPKKIFKPLGKAGSSVGNLLPEIERYVGGQTKVILCATHDTASAVEGVCMQKNEPYISSGTWSLLGVKADKALTDNNSLKANYSNEGGVGYIRYQKNIMGMWVVNRLKNELCPDKDFSEIVNEAENSNFNEVINVNTPEFLSPESMVKTFDDVLKNKPQNIADYFRCAYLSLAESYKNAIRELEKNVGKKFNKIYIVGGGAKNNFLNNLTEKATGKVVVALPIEATALGNLKIQMEA